MLSTIFYCDGITIEVSGRENNFHEAGLGVVESVEPRGAFFEGCDLSDEGFDFDGAARHEIDALGVFTVAAAASVDFDFAGDDLLQRQIDIWRDVAN